MGLTNRLANGPIAMQPQHVVEGGDHSLRVPKRQLQAMGETQEEVDQRAFGAVSRCIDQFAASAD